MLDALKQSVNLTTQWMLDETYLWYFWLRDTVVKITFVVSIIALLFWISTFFYGSFYYAYMPTAIHSRPVYFNFSPCERYHGSEECYFPYANLTFVTKPYTQQFLMRGQSYNIFLQMDVPQSPTNENLGMFMIKLELFASGGKIVEKSARPALIKYRSPLLKYIEVLFLSPFLMTGYKNEKEGLTVELFDNFIDNAYHPIVGANLMIQARRIEMYTASLEVYARFSGLRYFMFFWPISSAFFGIVGFFTLLSFITALSWYRCIGLISKNTQSLIQASGHGNNPAQSRYDARVQQAQRTVEQERLALARSRPAYTTVLDSSLTGVTPPVGRVSGQPHTSQTSEQSASASSYENIENEGPLTASIRARNRPNVETLLQAGGNSDVPVTENKSTEGSPSDSSGSSDSFVRVGEELLQDVDSATPHSSSEEQLLKDAEETETTVRRRNVNDQLCCHE
ncbi:seipin-like [Anneissia japonica]|uniref:seipin-like n=1 Tax=Anneissia japonica TaxID=1529436 RepID=UPI001425A442|nr:seipin-like [Anneissia japonica]